MSIENLIALAFAARENAYAPYSGFKVGAALLCEDGEMYSGCNVENAAFGPTNCAERTAFFKAISDGKRTFKSIAIVGGAGDEIKDHCAPCGVCRQVMAEFCDGDFEIITAKSADEFRVYKLSQLLPVSFSAKNIKD